MFLAPATILAAIFGSDSTATTTTEPLRTVMAIQLTCDGLDNWQTDHATLAAGALQSTVPSDGYAKISNVAPHTTGSNAVFMASYFCGADCADGADWMVNWETALTETLAKNDAFSGVKSCQLVGATLNGVEEQGSRKLRGEEPSGSSNKWGCSWCNNRQLEVNSCTWCPKQVKIFGRKLSVGKDDEPNGWHYTGGCSWCPWDDDILDDDLWNNSRD